MFLRTFVRCGLISYLFFALGSSDQCRYTYTSTAKLASHEIILYRFQNISVPKVNCLIDLVSSCEMASGHHDHVSSSRELLEHEINVGSKVDLHALCCGIDWFLSVSDLEEMAW